MDRRQLKTRKAIFVAFKELLEKKHYDQITVQDIIDRADVGRSTFYAHFETKDMLLSALCLELFTHIFERSCPYEGEGGDIASRLSHVLWHIKENDLGGLFLHGDSAVFLEYFKEQLKAMLLECKGELRSDVPEDFMLHYFVGAFCETVVFWIKGGYKQSPEELAKNFMKLTEK